VYYGAIVFPHCDNLDERGCFIVANHDKTVIKCEIFTYFNDFNEFLVEFLRQRLKTKNYRFYYHDDNDYSRFFRNRVSNKIDLDPRPYFRRLKKYDFSAVTELIKENKLQYHKDGDIMKALHMWDIGKKQKEDIVLTCLGVLCYGLLRRVEIEQ
jgi:hypothetical protein